MKISLHFIILIILFTSIYSQESQKSLTCSEISDDIDFFINNGKLDRALTLAKANKDRDGVGCDASYIIKLGDVFIKYNDFDLTRELFINAMKRFQENEYNIMDLEYKKLSSLLSQLSFIRKQYKNDREHQDAINRYIELLYGNKYCDQSESFSDADGDNQWDAEERYIDANENGLWDEGETYADDNLNNKWDPAEEFEDWKYPDIGMIYLYIADVYKNQKDHTNAVKYLNEATNINPSLEIYTKNLTNIAKLISIQGDNHLRLNQTNSAIDKYNQAISINPNLSTVLFNISIAYMKIEEFEQAIVHLTKVVELEPNKYKAFHKLGYCYQKLGSTSSSEIINEDDISKRDKNYLKSIINFKKSITLLNYSENKDVKYLSPYHALGVSFMEMKNYVDAVKILNEVIVKDEKYFKAYETLGILHKDASDSKYQSYHMSLDYLQKAAKIKPNHHVVKFRISQIYNILADKNKESKNYKKMSENSTSAKKFAKQSLRINKKYGGSHFELGYAELYLCNKSSGIKSLTKAGKLDKRYRSEVKRILKNVKNITAHCE